MRPFAAVAVLCLLVAGSLGAATFGPVPDSALVERADAIVVGTVLDSTSLMEGQRIFTDTTLRVERALKGTVGEHVTVRELGGSANGIALAIPGSAHYEKGQRVLAFLRQRPDGTFFTAYMGLGRFRFRDNLVTRDLDGVEVDDVASTYVADEFIDHVGALVRGEPVMRELTRVGSQPQTQAAASTYVFKDGSPQLPIRWKNCEAGCTINYFVSGGAQPNATDTIGGIEEAMANWTNHVDSFVTLDLDGPSGVTDVSNFDNENTIALNNTASPLIGQCDGSLACGLVWLSDGVNGQKHTFNGEEFYNALNGDIIVRPSAISGSGGQSQFVRYMAHELGHTLALKHAPTSGAVMSAQVATSSLKTYDKEAMAAVYGNGSTSCEPPVINSTSGGGNVTQGNTKQLSVSATGTAPLSYQWYQGTSGNTSTPVGTNSSQYTTPAVNSQMSFWVRVTNSCGSADSATITVTPVQGCDPPNITVQPQSQTIAPNNSATLSVGASGDNPKTYQWYQGVVGDTTTPVGTNSSTFTTPPLTNTTSYWVRVTNSCGNAASQLATITVSNCAPVINVQPQSQTITPNSNATLTVGAIGDSPLSFQWYQGQLGDTSTPVGTNANVFLTPALTTTTSYWVRVSNPCGNVSSQLATITVSAQCAPPQIAAQPGNLNLSVGSGATLNVSLAGSVPMTFQWYTGDSGDASNPIAGQTNTSYAAGPFNTAGTFKFWLKATNSCGTVNSSTIVITVACPAVLPPSVAAPPAAVFSAGYDITILTEEASLFSSFQVQEATNASFTENLKTFTVTGGAITQHINAHTEILTDTRFYYRVLGTIACSNAQTPLSATASTVVTRPLPENSNEFSVSVPVGEPITFVQNYLVPGFGDTATSNDTFSITTDVPWLTVFPPNGALSAGGTTVQFTINTTGLAVGTTTGTINVVRTQPSSSRIGTNGNTTSSVPFSVSLVTPVTPSPRSTTPPPGTLIIPAVAHADGIGTRFQSDVRITNASTSSISYELTFTPSGSNGTQVGKKTTLTIGANDTKGLDDIVKAWYGSGVLGETGLGTLEIRPLSTEAGALATFASSRTYAISNTGTLGQFIPAIPLANFIGDIAQNSLQKISLQQIANSNAYRTNFGFVEGGGATATMLVKLLDGSNNILQQVTRSIQPYGHEQLSFTSLFGNVALTDGRVEVSVTSSTGKATAYASVVDNNTSDPLLVFPVQANAFTSQHYVAPGIAELNNGASNFHSDMRVFNAGSAPVDVSLKYYPQGSSAPNATTIVRTIAGGAVLAVDNILPTLWSLDATGGAVTVDAAANSSLVVTARTYSRNETNGTFGQFIPGVTAREAVGLGERALEVMQLEQSAQFRSNVGLVEVTGAGPTTIEIMAYKPDTKTTAATSLTLQPNEFRQIGLIFQQMGLPTVYNGRVTVKVTGGQGRVAAYGSVVDNRTVDPTYVPSQ